LEDKPQLPASHDPGFLARAKLVPLGILNELGKTHLLVFAGHSLGGAVAMPLVLDCWKLTRPGDVLHANLAKPICITFGAPLVALSEYAAELNQDHPDLFYHGVHQDEESGPAPAGGRGDAASSE
jgi:hypothetical protein